MRPTGNTILITGATSGIGRALAEAFHARGNQVIVTGRRRSLLEEVTGVNPGMRGHVLDVDDPKAIAAFSVDLVASYPGLNVLINNAGISHREDLTHDRPDPGVAHAILRTNVGAVIDLTLALLPHLRRQPAACVMATTSGLAHVPRADYPSYCASKAFLHSWLQSVRRQMQGQVEVLELAPPYVQTELAGPTQAVDPAAMPLADYIAEVMELLTKGDTPNGEILVQRVRPLREAEAKGRYRQVYDLLNSAP